MYERKDKICLLYPAIATTAVNIIHDLAKRGKSFEIFETWRRPQDQKILLDKGITKAVPWRSWHQYGLAVDIVAKDVAGRWSWDQMHDWQLLGHIGMARGLVWGGSWKSRDMVHFQFPIKYELSIAQDIVAKEGILGLWDKI